MERVWGGQQEEQEKSKGGHICVQIARLPRFCRRQKVIAMLVQRLHSVGKVLLSSEWALPVINKATKTTQLKSRNAA